MLHGLNDVDDLVPLVASQLFDLFFVVDAWKVIEHKPYDHKVDVFSFGIVLWEMLTGKVMCHFFGSDNEYQKYSSLQIITLLYLLKIYGCTDFISIILFSD
jgi:serine/threonine protein kinase